MRGILRTERAFVAESLELKDPEGETFEVIEPTVKLIRAGTWVEEVRLDFRIPYRAWRKLDREGLFNDVETKRSKVFGGGLDNYKDVEIEARLDTSQAEALRTAESAEDAAEWLRGIEPESDVRNTQSWYALNVQQTLRPGLKTGYRTAYADTPIR